MILQRHAAGFLTALLVLAALGCGVGSRALAQASFDCPSEREPNVAKCQKLQRRQQLRQEGRARADALDDYRIAHPWRVSALADFTLFALGLDHIYVAHAWGAGVGASVLRELVPAWALRVDLLGRLGRGHINSWGIDRPGPIDTTAGNIAGVEAKVSLLRRLGRLYLGPALTGGFLHLHARTLRERDFGDSDDATTHVPGNRAFLSLGFVLGGEPVPEAPISVAFHLAPGVWDDMRHMYLSAAFSATIKLWD